MNYFAICIRCKNSVFLKPWQTGRYSCPLCGEDYGTHPQNKAGFLVESDLANQAYNTGQEYFKNTDFGEALKYFRQALKFNSNHYLAAYFVHMCQIYEEEINPNFDIAQRVAICLQDCIRAVVCARVDTDKRLGFVTLIYNQCLILVSKYYNRISQECMEKGDYSRLRQSSLDFALSIKKILDIDKEAVMAQNQAVSRNCVAMADIGVTACQNIVCPHVSQNVNFEHDLDLASKQQYHKARALSASFVTYAQSLNRSYVHSKKADYQAVLYYNDKFVLPIREKYYYHNAPFLNKYLSHRPDLFNELTSASMFVAEYAHNACFNSLFKEKNLYHEQLIYESVDNCLDALMPRILLTGKDKVDIFLLPFKEQGKVADYLNDFLNELYKYNREYAIKKVYSFFRYVYEGIKANYDKMQRRYFRLTTKLKDDRDYKRELGFHLNFLYQVSASCVLTALVNDIDKNVVGNVRDKMLQLAYQAGSDFDSMSKIDATKLKDLQRFVDFESIFDIITQAYGDYNQDNQILKDKKIAI
jgi:hypothetical protein